MRPAHLLSKTRFIILEFHDIPIVSENFERIDGSRKRRNYCPDPRNTTSYYLFCMSRYYLVLQSIKNNPFNSTHFAWCNICIERMSWKCGMYLPSIWKQQRDKFSTCYIDYQSKKWTLNLEEYYRYGRCGMCSGFFTGNIKYFSQFCNLILSKFSKMADIGLGHADEQLYSLVYFDNPEIFEFYYGDYTEMIINYCTIKDHPEKVVQNFMRNITFNIKNNEIDNISSNYKLLLHSTTKWLSETNTNNQTLINEVKLYHSFAQNYLNN